MSLPFLRGMIRCLKRLRVGPRVVRVSLQVEKPSVPLAAGHVSVPLLIHGAVIHACSPPASRGARQDNVEKFQTLDLARANAFGWQSPTTARLRTSPLDP